jgi:hypothetical protein
LHTSLLWPVIEILALEKLICDGTGFLHKLVGSVEPSVTVGIQPINQHAANVFHGWALMGPMAPCTLYRREAFKQRDENGCVLRTVLKYAIEVVGKPVQIAA